MKVRLAPLARRVMVGSLFYGANGQSIYSPIDIGLYGLVKAAPPLSNLFDWWHGDYGRFEDAGATTLASENNDPMRAWRGLRGNILSDATGVQLKTAAFNGKACAYFAGANKLSIGGSLTFNRNNFCVVAVLQPTGNLDSDMAHFSATGNTLRLYTHVIHTLDYGSGIFGPWMGQMPVAILWAADGTRTYSKVFDTEQEVVASPTSAVITGADIGSVGFQGYIRHLAVYGACPSTSDLSRLWTWAKAEALEPVPASGKVMVCDGDSITAGGGASDVAHGWVQQCVGLLSGWTAFVPAIFAQTLLDCLVNVAGRVNRLYHASQTKHVRISAGGSNDIALGATAATTYQRQKDYCNALKAANNAPIIVCDVLPRTGQQTENDAYNALLAADFNVATADPLVWDAGAGATYVTPGSQLVQWSAVTGGSIPDGVHPDDGRCAAMAAKVAFAVGRV